MVLLPVARRAVPPSLTPPSKEREKESLTSRTTVDFVLDMDALEGTAGHRVFFISVLTCTYPSWNT
jgi:hypothetical protein